MNSFPIISTLKRVDCFNIICNLLGSHKQRVLVAAEIATSNDRSPFIASSDPSKIDSQIQEIEERIKRTADRIGQNLLIRLIEELYEDISTNGIPGISDRDLIDKVLFKIDQSEICYNATKKWNWKWSLKVDENERDISLSIRNSTSMNSKIVPDYILQYVRQSINSFQNNAYATSLSLISIALEGTLRDALTSKGYDYNRNANVNDVYELKEIHIHKETDGYKITFPDSMPLPHANYLTNPGDPGFKIARIKRSFDNRGRQILEIRDVNDILDYWSSNTITQPAQIKIGGLGAALDIGRNRLNIFTSVDLPPDLDKPIQAVRNNLIHLSENSLEDNVTIDSAGRDIKLKDFLEDRNRVFDTICTIGDAINKIYNKIANGIL